MLKLTLFGALGVLILLYSTGPLGIVNACTTTERATGHCGTSNDGTRLTIDGTKTTPGPNPGSSPIGDRRFDNQSGPAPREFDFDECRRDWDSDRGCFRQSTKAEPAIAQPAPGIPAFTITDLAQFSPPPSPLVGEPANVGIAGMPTNFVAAASVTTVTGTLFGLPVTVRFTPSGYDFHYGDGSDATTRTGGQSWATLGQPQFTPSATSHVYRDRGAFIADVDVRYTAEVDLGTGWFPVSGELTADGPAQEIRIFEAHTALVARTCAEQPGAPGC